MIKTRDITVVIESEEKFHKKLDMDLKKIDKGNFDIDPRHSISFQSLNQMRKYLTPKRIELLKVIKKKNPDSIYALAKLVGRAVDNVNTDIKELKTMGFIEIEKVKKPRRRSIPKVNYDSITMKMEI